MTSEFFERTEVKIHRCLIHGEQKLERFLKDLNNLNPNLSFTHEASKSCISYFNLKVKMIDGTLGADLYIKPIDRHEYLNYLSSHPKHIKRSIRIAYGIQRRILTFPN